MNRVGETIEINDWGVEVRVILILAIGWHECSASSFGHFIPEGENSQCLFYVRLGGKTLPATAVKQTTVTQTTVNHLPIILDLVIIKFLEISGSIK